MTRDEEMAALKAAVAQWETRKHHLPHSGDILAGAAQAAFIDGWVARAELLEAPMEDRKSKATEPSLPRRGAYVNLGRYWPEWVATCLTLGEATSLERLSDAWVRCDAILLIEPVLPGPAKDTYYAAGARSIVTIRISPEDDARWLSPLEPEVILAALSSEAATSTSGLEWVEVYVVTEHWTDGDEQSETPIAVFTTPAVAEAYCRQKEKEAEPPEHRNYEYTYGVTQLEVWAAPTP